MYRAAARSNTSWLLLLAVKPELRGCLATTSPSLQLRFTMIPVCHACSPCSTSSAVSLHAFAESALPFACPTVLQGSDCATIATAESLCWPC